MGLRDVPGRLAARFGEGRKLEPDARAGFPEAQRVRNHFSKAVRCRLLTVSGGLGSRPECQGMSTTDEGAET